MLINKVTLPEQAIERIARIKKDSMHAKQYLCVQRARYLTKAYRENQAEPMILRRAKAFRMVLEKTELFIEEGQLLVGNHASRLRAAPIFPEYSVSWIFEEINEFQKRPGDRFYVEKAEHDELLEIAEWWRGKTLEDRCMATIPPEVKMAYEMNVLSASGNITSGDGHIMLDFEKIISCGADGIIKEAQAALESLDLTVPENCKKHVFYQSIIVAYQGVIAYADRYAALAESLAESEKDPRRKQEIAKIGEICRRVPRYPARTFYEGIQTVWFVHLLSQIESNGHSMSFGRLDQYLYPFYQRDIDAGVITDEFVVELLACLWLKAFGVIKIRPWAHTRFSGGGPTYQNLTLGGLTPDGKDAVNNLTLRCLDSVTLTKLPQPNVSARYHECNPDKYLKKCLEVIAMGFGMPAMHSDRLMIASLTDRGVSQSDANNYAIVGCIEPIVPGKFGYRAAGMSFTNFAKMLEITFNGGLDPLTGHMLKDLGRKLANCKSFEEVMEDYKTICAQVVRLRVTGEHCIDFNIEELVPDAFCSGLVQDCMGRGKTAKEGGSVYDMVTGPETGIVNAANSLEAVRELVFDKKELTMEQLDTSLRNNFSGLEGENIRKNLLNRASKFGNDIDSVDNLASRLYLVFMEEQSKYPTARIGRGPIGCISYPCTATISGNVPSGVNVGATPEGRFAGEPLTEGCSPYHGTDKVGPTAVLNSVAKMPNRLITGGNLLNLRFSPSVFSSGTKLKKMMGMIKVFFLKGGWHVQFNIISTKTLQDAQKNPEKYEDLVVRVAGYSALFNDLEQKTQNDIIARTEHEL